VPERDPDRRHTAEMSAVTMRALDELAAVLSRTSADFDRLAERARVLRNELADGMELRPAMAAEARPLIITQMTRIIDELTGAALAVRRAEAEQLRQEGLSQQAIADVFGVSRQRVAALLAAPETDHEGRVRKAYRPAQRDSRP
jgi:hypothetical protein